MIPRFKAHLGLAEFAAIAGMGSPNDVARFEAAFARQFDMAQAVAFPYGRSALWALFRLLGLKDADVVQPAYTCVVVAHATVLSGNVPRFVDANPADFNMDLDQLEAAITGRTRVVIPTHLFGYPLNVERVQEIVAAAERRHGHKIWIVQDCAHAFGAASNGRPVCGSGDAAIFGLGISKLVTSIFGGMLTTGDADLAARLRVWRDDHFAPRSVLKDLQRRLYLLAAAAAFDERVYGLVHWLETHTPLLNRLTQGYHLDDQIHFPPDYLQRMQSVEARVGLAQLEKYPEIVTRRAGHARHYDRALRSVPALELPPLMDGATYSHYVALVPNRDHVIDVLGRQGIQLGRLIEYSVPHMACYRDTSQPEKFPVSRHLSEHSLNLPVHAGLTETARARIVSGVVAAMQAGQPSTRMPAAAGAPQRV